jgi:hypothetical protein
LLGVCDQHRRQHLLLCGRRVLNASPPPAKNLTVPKTLCFGFYFLCYVHGCSERCRQMQHEKVCKSI